MLIAAATLALRTARAAFARGGALRDCALCITPENAALSPSSGVRRMACGAILANYPEHSFLYLSPRDNTGRTYAVTRASAEGLLLSKHAATAPRGALLSLGISERRRRCVCAAAPCFRGALHSLFLLLPAARPRLSSLLCPTSVRRRAKTAAAPPAAASRTHAGFAPCASPRLLCDGGLLLNAVVWADRHCLDLGLR